MGVKGTVLVLLIIFSITPAWATTISLEANSTTLTIGEPVRIDLLITDVEDLFSFSVDLNYDPYTFIGQDPPEEGTFLNESGATPTICLLASSGEGTYNDWGCTRWIGVNSGVTGSGVLASMILIANTSGTTTINLSDTLLLNTTFGNNHIPHNATNETITIAAPGGNQAPSIAAISDQDYGEGRTILIQTSANDPDDDPLSYSLDDDYGFLSVNATGAILGTTPESGTTGYAVTMNVNDGEYTDSSSFTLTVHDSDPNIIITAPSTGTYGEAQDLSYTVTDYDGDIDTCWYVLNAGAAVILPSCSGTSGIGEAGSNTLTVHVNDSTGREDQDSITYNIDQTGPIITYINPTPVNTTANTTFTISISTSETAWGAILMWNGTNETMNANGSYWSTQKTVIPGNYTYLVYANDSYGNRGKGATQWVEANGTTPTCTDGTMYGTCSDDRPEYCDAGTIIDKSSVCGCPSGYERDGESCRKKNTGGGGGGGGGGSFYTPPAPKEEVRNETLENITITYTSTEDNLTIQHSSVQHDTLRSYTSFRFWGAEKANVSIKVPKSWTRTNGIDADSLAVQFREGTGWTPYASSVTEEDEDYLIDITDAEPGLYTVTAEKESVLAPPTTIGPTEEEEAQAAAAGQAAEKASQQPEERAKRDRKQQGIDIIIGIGVLLLFFGVAWYAHHKSMS